MVAARFLPGKPDPGPRTPGSRFGPACCLSWMVDRPVVVGVKHREKETDRWSNRVSVLPLSVLDLAMVLAGQFCTVAPAATTTVAKQADATATSASG